MAVINLTPDSFYEPSRVRSAQVQRRVATLLEEGADIVDLGAVSTRPGAAPVSLEQEWLRLLPALRRWNPEVRLSVDTTRAEIVRRVYDRVGPFMVNDISAGEDDREMLATVGELGLPYVAMHKRGDPRTMDSLVSYPDGIMAALKEYFTVFASRADTFGVRDWILDPGLGFAKTPVQCWEILWHLKKLRSFGHPILIGAADKRFTEGDTEQAHRLALQNGADILRVHDVAAARATILQTTV